MSTPAPAFEGGWITGRFRGHYEAEARGLVRIEGLEVRRVRLLRGTLTDARFSPIGPMPDEAGPHGALRQEALREVWVAAGVGSDGHPLWQPVSLTDVWLCAWKKGADELLGANGLGELAGTLWGRLPGGQEAEIGAVEPVPDDIPSFG